MSARTSVASTPWGRGRLLDDGIVPRVPLKGKTQSRLARVPRSMLRCPSTPCRRLRPWWNDRGTSGGSGYGTSSGSIRAITEWAQTISPPPRSERTSESPPCDGLSLTGCAPRRRRPARLGQGPPRPAGRGTPATMTSSPRVHKRMKHADTELAWVLAVRAGDPAPGRRSCPRRCAPPHLRRAHLRRR